MPENEAPEWFEKGLWVLLFLILCFIIVAVLYNIGKVVF